MKRTLGICCTLLFFTSVTAQEALPPRILAVYTGAEHIYITGQNLPRGSLVRVSLGDADLEVLRSTATLIVAELPELSADSDYRLVVERGVETLEIEGSAITWGFLLPVQRSR